MTLPSPDDREAVRLWIVKTFPDHGYDGMGDGGLPEYDLDALDKAVDAVLSLVRAAVEREREECEMVASKPLINGEAWHVADRLGRTRLGSLTDDERKAIGVMLEMRARAIRARRSPS